MENFYENMPPRRRSRSVRKHVSKRSRRYTVGRRTQYRYRAALSNAEASDQSTGVYTASNGRYVTQAKDVYDVDVAFEGERVAVVGFDPNQRDGAVFLQLPMGPERSKQNIDQIRLVAREYARERLENEGIGWWNGYGEEPKEKRAESRLRSASTQ